MYRQNDVIDVHDFTRFDYGQPTQKGLYLKLNLPYNHVCIMLCVLYCVVFLLESRATGDVDITEFDIDSKLTPYHFSPVKSYLRFSYRPLT